MTFTLLESLSLPGNPARANEDAFASSDSAALVLDGATPLGDEPLMPGTSDAAWLAQFGSRRLMAHLKDGDGPRDALENTLADAAKSFEALRRRPVRERWEIPCASMMLVTQSASALECLWFGDCTALVQHGDACEIIGDAFERRGLEAYSARRLASDKKLTPSLDFNRSEMIGALRASRSRINSGKNWLFSPDPRAAAHVSHLTLKGPPGTVLLVASDGFLALATDYGAYDAMGLVTAARNLGLLALAAELRAIESEDAMGEKFARFKKSDDATALLIEVT